MKTHPARSNAAGLDPYYLEETTFTLEEVRRARQADEPEHKPAA